MPVKVSVIIPFFNSMQYLSQLMESIPVCDEIEILVVDDKSAQQETEQLTEYVAQAKKKRNVAYYYNDEAKSAGTCRNIGLRHAVGEWVLFADADDYFTEDLYQTLAPWFTQDVDVVYFTPISMDRVTNQSADRHVYLEDLLKNYQKNPSAQLEYRLKTFYTVPWSKLFRRCLLQEQGILFDEVRASNDVMFSVKAAFATEKIAVSDDVIYCVTKSPGSLLYSVDKEVLDARLAVYISRYRYVKQRVPKDVFASFNLDGRNARNRVIQYAMQKQSPVAVLGAACKLLLSGVSLFELRLLNPVVLIGAIKRHLSVYRKNKKYYKTHQK